MGAIAKSLETNDSFTKMGDDYSAVVKKEKHKQLVIKWEVMRKSRICEKVVQDFLITLHTKAQKKGIH